MKKSLSKIWIALLMASLVLALFGGVPAMAQVDPTPSTNDINRTNGWAHVDQTAVGVGSTTLQFISTRAFFSCFEYRTDGDTSQMTSPTNYNPLITDGLYPFTCRNNNTISIPFTASGYVEVRMVFGAEADERFDWTRFDVLPPPVLSATTGDALFCTGQSTIVTIDLSYVENLYGYQFAVSYDPAVASAIGAFDNSFFDTSVNAAIPPLWNAVCASGTCKFAAAKQAPATPLAGSGDLATITLTGVAAGTFDMTFSADVLSDINGAPLAHTLGADLPMTVCGLANISGFVTLQGRPGNIVDAGTVSLIEQGTNFTPPGVGQVPFSVSNGAYSFTGVPFMPGGSNYQIVAEHGLYLDNQEVFPVSGNVTNKNTRLWGGDANNDGGVEVDDLSCIGGAFDIFPVTADCGGFGSPDINADAVVNIQDLSLAGGNFDKCGAQPWAYLTGTPMMCP